MVTKKVGRKKASRKAFSCAPMESLELAVAIKCFSTLDLAITRREVHIEKSSPLSLSLESQMQNMKTNWEAASNVPSADDTSTDHLWISFDGTNIAAVFTARIDKATQAAG